MNWLIKKRTNFILWIYRRYVAGRYGHFLSPYIASDYHVEYHIDRRDGLDLKITKRYNYEAARKIIDRLMRDDVFQYKSEYRVDLDCEVRRIGLRIVKDWE